MRRKKGVIRVNSSVSRQVSRQRTATLKRADP